MVLSTDYMSFYCLSCGCGNSATSCWVLFRWGGSALCSSFWDQLAANGVMVLGHEFLRQWLQAYKDMQNRPSHSQPRFWTGPLHVCPCSFSRSRCLVEIHQWNRKWVSNMWAPGKEMACWIIIWCTTYLWFSISTFLIIQCAPVNVQVLLLSQKSHN